MIHNYTWEKADLMGTGRPCKSKACQKAHYRDGKPRRRMDNLVRTPSTKLNCVQDIWMCSWCKRIDLR